MWVGVGGCGWVCVGVCVGVCGCGGGGGRVCVWGGGGVGVCVCVGGGGCNECHFMRKEFVGCPTFPRFLGAEFPLGKKRRQNVPQNHHAFSTCLPLSFNIVLG